MSHVGRTVSFAGCSVAINCADVASTDIVDWLFAHLDCNPALPRQARFRLAYDEPAAEFSLFQDQTLEYRGPCRGTAAAFLLDRVVQRLAEGARGGALLHAACVAHVDKAILIPGTSGAGKTTLTAWLAARGYSYLTDELTLLGDGATSVQALRRPLNLKRPLPVALEVLLQSGDGETIAPTPDGVLLSPRRFPSTSNGVEIAAIVFPAYRPGAELEMVPVSAARTATLLLGALVNAPRLPEYGMDHVVQLAQTAPACALTWGDVDQVGDRISRWLRGEALAPGRDLASP